MIHFDDILVVKFITVISYFERKQVSKKTIPYQVEHAMKKIRDGICSGRYSSSQHLVLRSIAKDSKMSIIPIRDALTKLQQEGLVEAVSGRGWHVPEYDEERLKQVSEVREALECQVVRSAAVRATREDLEELELLARQADRETSTEKANLIDRKFHLYLAKVAKNPRIYEAIKREQVLELIFGKPETSPNEHLKVVQAIATGDPEIAVREIRKHFIKLSTKTHTD